MCTAQVQGVVATLLFWIDSRCSFSASAGVFQASVLRGRLLRAAATALSSPGFQRARSVPLGKYWRSSPLDAPSLSSAGWGGGLAGCGFHDAVEAPGDGALEAAPDVAVWFALGGAPGFVGAGF